MQMDQLFEFVYILIDKKQVTAKEMACHFGVSTRTVYRWIDALSLSGVPVYSTRGNGGGISISEKYTLDKTLHSEDERLAIVSSVKAFNSLSGNSKSNEMAGNKAVEKICLLRHRPRLPDRFFRIPPPGQGLICCSQFLQQHE